MTRNVTVTWEDLRLGEEEDSDFYSTSGFVSAGGYYSEYDESFSREKIVSMINDARQDLDSMIECEFCVAPLIVNSDGEWVSALTHSNIGINRFEEEPHIHKPQSLWYEVLVDMLYDYGALEDSNGSWYSEYFTVDYRLGIDRQYAVHLDWDPTDEEWLLIENEIKLRKQNLREMIAKLS